MSLILLAALTAFAASATAATAVPRPLGVDGLVAATYSPFERSPAGQALNITQVEADAAFLRSTGVLHVFVCGTTGESLSLQVEERKRLAEAWVRVAPKHGIRVIVHAGAESLKDAAELAAHAERIGADAVAAMPPVFFKPATPEALARSMALVARAAPSLPFYYYHIPSMTGSNFSMSSFVDEMEALPEPCPNFVGIKYTGLYGPPPGGFPDAQRVMRRTRSARLGGGAYEVLGGRDEMMVEALAVGVRGFVGSQYNFAAELYNGIRHRFAARGAAARDDAGVSALDLQLAALDLLAVWQAAPPGVDGAKALKVLSGVDVGDARPPSLPVSSEFVRTLHASTLAWCAKPVGAESSGMTNARFLGWCRSLGAAPTA
jgi:N-acetylneuraminate lyase